MAEPALEEVIVTAQRREQNLQDTPISIAAFGEDEIERRRITNIADLAAIVPNLRIVPFGVSPTTLRIYIRGVGVVDSQVTQDPPVGIYLNGVYVARPVGLTLDLAGIERVEVLRGPQGTLYGRNTTGGAINIITKKPGDELEFSQLARCRQLQRRPLADDIERTARRQVLSGCVLYPRQPRRVAREHRRRQGFLGIRP